MSRSASSAATGPAPSFTLYRNTTIGETLKDSLQELVDLDRIDADTALRILQEFDRVCRTKAC